MDMDSYKECIGYNLKVNYNHYNKFNINPTAYLIKCYKEDLEKSGRREFATLFERYMK